MGLFNLRFCLAWRDYTASDDMSVLLRAQNFVARINSYWRYRCFLSWKFSVLKSCASNKTFTIGVDIYCVCVCVFWLSQLMLSGGAREHPKKKGQSRLGNHMGGIQVYEICISCICLDHYSHFFLTWKWSTIYNRWFIHGLMP